jgi:hypothetical protein
MHWNAIFDRESIMPLDADHFGPATKSHHQGLHFDAADHLIA